MTRDPPARKPGGNHPPSSTGHGLALRKAILVAYHLDRLPTQREVLDIADKWRPYRSLATSYLFSAAYEPAEAPPAGLTAVIVNERLGF